MFRSTSISIILLALAICAASPSQCFGQDPVRRKVAYSHPFWPSPKSTDEGSGSELANPFDPFPDASELTELDSILATWDRVFGEKPFNRRNFREWDYDALFGPTDPDVAKEFREGVLTCVGLQRWSIRETRATQSEPLYEPVESDKYVLFRNFFGPHLKPTGKFTYRAIPTAEWVCDDHTIAFWNSGHSSPTIVPFEAEHDSPLIAVLAFCGNGQARELAHRYRMRVVSRESADDQPRIEIRPRLEMDARTWHEIVVLLAADQTPYAIEIIENKSRRTVFEFTDRTNVWWPDERRFTELARLRKREADFKKALEEQPVD